MVDFAMTFESASKGLCKSLLKHKNDVKNIVVQLGTVDNYADQVELCRCFNIHTVMVKPTTDFNNLKRLVEQAADCAIQVAIEFPIFGSDKCSEDAWMNWCTVQRMLNYVANVTVALHLTGIGHGMQDNSIFEKWLCEPIAVLIFETDILSTLKSCYYSSSFTKKLLMKSRPYFLQGRDNEESILIQETSLLPNLTEMLDDFYIDPYVEWSYHIERNDMGMDSPLKPVTDILSSTTYTHFEKDRFKYQRYGEAICIAIINIAQQKQKDREQLKINVAIFGASRGALVNLAYKACQKVGPDFTCCVTAIEVNQFAILALKQRNKIKWKDSVRIKCVDFRHYEPDDKLDLVVSEFLGSFACNELAPEVFSTLDSITKPSTIIIPKSYTSYIQPGYVPKFRKYLGTKSCKEMMEEPYIINFAGIIALAKPAALFSYQDPCEIGALKRLDKTMDFMINISGEITGFLGYFHAILLEDMERCIDISLLLYHHPSRFNLQDAISVKEGDTVRVHWSRINDGVKVWYEWQVQHLQNDITTGVHNIRGKYFHLFLY